MHVYTLYIHTYIYIAIQDLAKMLVEKAREVSIDTQRDSPFAVLAKENDVMWGGGMPDDTSVGTVYKSCIYDYCIYDRFECICLCMHRSIMYDVYVITLTVCYIVYRWLWRVYTMSISLPVVYNGNESNMYIRYMYIWFIVCIYKYRGTVLICLRLYEYSVYTVYLYAHSNVILFIVQYMQLFA